MFHNSSKQPLLFAVCDQFKLFTLEIFSKSVKKSRKFQERGVET